MADDFGRGIIDKAKHKLSKAVKEIPVFRSCKCDDKQCGCCLVFMTEEKNISCKYFLHHFFFSGHLY